MMAGAELFSPLQHANFQHAEPDSIHSQPLAHGRFDRHHVHYVATDSVRAEGALVKDRLLCWQYNCKEMHSNEANGR
jgi:hypothetical protein